VRFGQFVLARSVEIGVSQTCGRGVSQTYGIGVSHTCFGGIFGWSFCTISGGGETVARMWGNEKGSASFFRVKRSLLGLELRV